ncbi:Adenylosuccinate lyase [Desulfovibrionales bacterium]
MLFLLMIERYSRPPMRRLWSLENKFRVWLEVELAICEAWHELGAIPMDALAEIRAKADFDVARILDIEKETGHDVIAFLAAIEEKVGPAARFVHLGCTSSDIVDTANGLLLARAGTLLDQAFEATLAIIKSLAMGHKGCMTMGRTHGIHAEPTSFGLKMAGHYAELTRAQKHVAEACRHVSVGKLSGAVGTYAFLDPRLEVITLDRLGLSVDPISTQIIQRDRYARFITAIAVAGCSIERLCVELRHLQRTEVLEAEEKFAKGQKGSSAMPHKKNPVAAENLTGLSRLLRGNALAAMENVALWHERDISHSSVERVIFPDSTTLLDYMLHRLTEVLSHLIIYPNNMERNLHTSYDLFYSQRVLIALVKAGVPRQEAYVIVQRLAIKSWQDKIHFPSKVKNDSNITAHLSSAIIDDCFDPNYYLRHEDLIYNRVFGPVIT